MVASLQININTIRIADIDTGSAVAIGNNYFFNWQSHSKTNNGFGRINGDRNSLSEAIARVDDPDFQDMLSNEWQWERDFLRLLELE